MEERAQLRLVVLDHAILPVIGTLHDKCLV
jgi:hypothetical protein